MSKVCVVVPIHSNTPTRYELISFEQCFKVLHAYPIKIVAPEGLSLSEYKKVISDLDVWYINPKWQSSLLNYNKLKTSQFFYNLFSNFDYLLTYELDAFVFGNELESWCQLGYDYIGAPWFEGYGFATDQSKIIGVGNSGFSLRKVKPIRTILKSLYYKNPEEYQNGTINLLKAYLKWPYRWLMSQTGENYTVQNNFPFYEDIFFSKYLPSICKDFKVAPIEEAMRFSFEVNPKVLYKINKEQLPMGCHAWWRYDLNFWKPFIESYGYNL